MPATNLWYIETALEAAERLRLAGEWDVAIRLVDSQSSPSPALAVTRIQLLVDRQFWLQLDRQEVTRAIAGLNDQVLDFVNGLRLKLQELQFDYSGRVFGDASGSARTHQQLRDQFKELAVAFGGAGQALERGWTLFFADVVAQNLLKDPGREGHLFEEPLEIALASGSRLLESYARRHLGGELQLRESLRLRQQLGFIPGTAAARVALAACLALDDPEREWQLNDALIAARALRLTWVIAAALDLQSGEGKP